jgi:hypothetical protein
MQNENAGVAIVPDGELVFAEFEDGWFGHDRF